ncbi:hypothetical protein OS493_000175 [Desmophyllum pertusum]|uniref:Uncharacterized protein n=1 Tax=Desmophyllum pertusum TaxID=174260 RepID=A0A9X0A6N0_9CNID|nr:hypothetical protein OS493_000175 [Desmophyllum pertusum]
MTEFLTVPKPESSSNADCEDAEKHIPVEFNQVNEPAFLEHLPDKKPSEAVNIRDISTDKLEKKDLKNQAGETRKGPIDAQAASSSDQSACEPLDRKLSH